MKREEATMKALYRAVQVVGLLLALMYIQSFYGFYVHKNISFINYQPISDLEVWTVRNLAVRLLAIAVGLIIALLARNKSMLAMAFAIRLTADVGDWINSVTNVAIESFVPNVLSVFVIAEVLCLLSLFYLIRKEEYGA